MTDGIPGVGTFWSSTPNRALHLPRRHDLVHRRLTCPAEKALATAVNPASHDPAAGTVFSVAEGAEILGVTDGVDELRGGPQKIDAVCSVRLRLHSWRRGALVKRLNRGSTRDRVGKPGPHGVMIVT